MSVMQELWHKKHLYFFLLPTFAFLIVFSYYPPLFAIYNSFFQWDGFQARVFIGLQNFRDIFRDKVFLLSLIHILETRAPDRLHISHFAALAQLRPNPQVHQGIAGVFHPL